MSLQSAKKTTILGQTVIILFAKRIILPCVCVIGLVSAAGAGTFTDPDPEVSSTEFGHAIVVIGDVTGDGIPDLAVAAPFQDGDFVSTAAGYGYPQNVGKIYFVDGATFTVFNQLTDPEFDLIQPQHFGGQLGGSLAVIADINGVLKGVDFAGVNEKSLEARRWSLAEKPGRSCLISKIRLRRRVGGLVMPSPAWAT